MLHYAALRSAGLFKHPLTIDEQFVSIVHEYLNLIAEPNIEKIEDEDPEILESLAVMVWDIRI